MEREFKTIDPRHHDQTWHHQSDSDLTTNARTFVDHGPGQFAAFYEYAPGRNSKCPADIVIHSAIEPISRDEVMAALEFYRSKGKPPAKKADAKPEKKSDIDSVEITADNAEATLDEIAAKHGFTDYAIKTAGKSIQQKLAAVKEFIAHKPKE